MSAQMPSGIRIATKADEEAIFELMKLLAVENAMAPMNPEKVWEMIKFCTEGRGGVIGLVDTPHRKAVAAVCLVPRQLWYADAWHIEEIFAFVHPDFRHENNIQTLIDFAKWFAETIAQMPLFMGILTTKRAEAKTRLYRRQIPCVGAIFLHGAYGGAESPKTTIGVNESV